jgi:arylsulfatase A-like enzyme
LLPTVCDYAGIKDQADPRGKSLRPLFEGKEVEWKKTLGVEGQISRMVIRKDGYKYVRYDAAGFEERLMDLNKDTFEKTHFTNDPDYKQVLSELQKAFDEEWFSGLK